MSKKSPWKKIIAAGAVLGCFYAVLQAAAVKRAEEKDIDKGNPYRKKKSGKQECGKQEGNIYLHRIKPALDKFLSFAGLVALSPVYGAVALAIVIDDPGPIFFTQKRIGKDKRFILIHKFRTMKMSAPHDVPTHLLENPDQYITKVGRVLRKTSLDELPQIWDIFRGTMSIIGPRPALWNQADLVEERDRYGANDVLPGLTGLAQIQGRDELEISAKAALDGQYVRTLNKGGMTAFWADVRCFMDTILSVAKGEGVVEGGTGAQPNPSSRRKSGAAADSASGAVDTVPDAAALRAAMSKDFEDYGFHKVFHIDLNVYKKVLVTGAHSYIGESFAAWAGEHYPNLTVDTLDMVEGAWREYDFSSYDTVFHVAGIAHADVGKASEAEKARYYEVNTDLAIETAQKAKMAGVRQFIFMSSMIVYGDSAPYGKEKVIDEHTQPSPANFYGDSKWQADQGVRKLAEEDFAVSVLRPPMIFGRGSKGNYPVLSKMARRLPLFPEVDNRRSMLHIDSLCEFVCKLALSGQGGIYFPQNEQYSNTFQMVRSIAAAAGKKVHTVKALKPVVGLASCLPGKVGNLVHKAFGNSVYSQKLSVYEGLEYRVHTLEESIAATEGGGRETATEGSPHILLVSQYFYPETFRINDMAAEWVKRGYKVTVLTGIPNYPMGKFFKGYGYGKKRREKWKGMDIIRIPLIPRGTGSIGMAVNYCSFTASGWFWNLYHNIHADLVFTYEVSPMTQALIGCWYARKHNVPHFLYVQDLWPENVETVTGIHNRFLIKPIDLMVDYIYKNADRIFTTSPSFSREIVNRKVRVDRRKVHYWPQYAEEFYRPVENVLPDNSSFKIAFTGNIGTAQGLDILPQAAEKLRNMNLSRPVQFVIVGDGRYQEQFQREIARRKVKDSFIMIPRQKPERIPEILSHCHGAFLSFTDTELWEKTIPAKLQSYMACGMPIIAAARGETKRIIEEACCGVCCEIGDSNGLAESIAGVMEGDLEKMGRNSRDYCERHYKKEVLMDEMDAYFASFLR